MKHPAMNPYLPLYEYIPDGEPRIFGDRLYVYGSHDYAGGEFGFCAGDYMVWSAPLDDLGDWRCDGVAYRRDQCPDGLFACCFSGAATSRKTFVLPSRCRRMAARRIRPGRGGVCRILARNGGGILAFTHAGHPESAGLAKPDQETDAVRRSSAGRMRSCAGTSRHESGTDGMNFRARNRR